MKPLLIVGLLAAASQLHAEVEIIPQPFGKDRYAETIAKGPFVLETKVVEEVVVKKDDPFANLYLRGIGKNGEQDYVLIQRLGEDKAMRFDGSEPVDGMFVKSVKSGGTFREASVVVQKGTDTGEIRFKEEAIAAPPAAQPRQPGANGPGVPQFTRPGVPQIPGTMPSAVRTVPPMPTAPVPRPQTPTSIPLPKAPTSVQPPTSNPSGGTRGRVRVINN